MARCGAGPGWEAPLSEGFTELTVQGRDRLHGTRGQVVPLGPGFGVPVRFDTNCPTTLLFIVPPNILGASTWDANRRFFYGLPPEEDTCPTGS